jgi:hypothetical protein
MERYRRCQWKHALPPRLMLAWSGQVHQPASEEKHSARRSPQPTPYRRRIVVLPQRAKVKASGP